MNPLNQKQRKILKAVSEGKSSQWIISNMGITAGELRRLKIDHEIYRMHNFFNVDEVDCWLIPNTNLINKKNS